MIIGADKERVRLLEIEADLAYGVIEHLRDALTTIANTLNEYEPRDIVMLAHEVYNSIGRCKGHLEYYKEHHRRTAEDKEDAD